MARFLGEHFYLSSQIKKFNKNKIQNDKSWTENKIVWKYKNTKIAIHTHTCTRSELSDCASDSTAANSGFVFPSFSIQSSNTQARFIVLQWKGERVIETPTRINGGTTTNSPNMWSDNNFVSTSNGTHGSKFLFNKMYRPLIIATKLLYCSILWCALLCLSLFGSIGVRVCAPLTPMLNRDHVLAYRYHLYMFLFSGLRSCTLSATLLSRSLPLARSIFPLWIMCCSHMKWHTNKYNQTAHICATNKSKHMNRPSHMGSLSVSISVVRSHALALSDSDSDGL